MIVVHGGAGKLDPERIDRVRAGVRAAAAAGRTLLERGGTALDAVVSAVRVLENDPEFGCGTGAALTRDGTVETCASVMDGMRRRAGAVAAAPELGAPVIVARAVLETNEHVILAGPAAVRFATELGFPPTPPGSLITERTRALLAEAQAGAQQKPPVIVDGGGVGAVARDRNGGFAAAVSGGGAFYRRAGSVDDASIPGVGSWADGEVAIATSGSEAIFRIALAKDIARQVADGTGIRKAVKTALVELRKLAPDAVAGAICVSKDSWCALQIGPHMPTAWVDDYGPNDQVGFEL